MDATSEIPDDRKLTPKELGLTRWLIEQGVPDAQRYASQVDRARVRSRCGCGCASINLAIDGADPKYGGAMRILADYQWMDDDGAMLGIFLFAHDDLLAGLDVWSQDGLSDAKALPEIEWLRPIGTATSGEP